MRFIEPEHVRDLSGHGFGIHSEPGDVENVVSYSVISDPDSQHPDLVEAADVVHIKMNTDSGAKRGLPTLYPVRKNLERADKLLRNMSTLAQIQSTFAAIRQHKQVSASAIDTFRCAQADVQTTNPFTGQDSFTKQFPPGSIIDTNDQSNWIFPSVGVNAGGLVQILQAELRACAARLVMPEYMLTVDASNANFASTLVAEAPSTKNFERLQAFFARRFGDGGYIKGRLCGLLWRVIERAVRAGRLPQEVLEEIEIQAEGPSLIARDKSSETQRAGVLNEKGILSKATWSKWEGVDREQERKQIEAERAEEPQQPIPGNPDDPGDEDDDPFEFGGDNVDALSTPPGSANGDTVEGRGDNRGGNPKNTGQFSSSPGAKGGAKKASGKPAKASGDKTGKSSPGKADATPAAKQASATPDGDPPAKETDTTRADRAKASAKPAGVRIQRWCEEHNEPICARMVGGEPMPDNLPTDIEVGGKKRQHGCELKTMTDNDNVKITMKRSAMERKAAWEAEHQAPFHTIVFDDREVFDAKGHDKHDESKREIYYRRGYGSFRVLKMYKVKDAEDLKRMMNLPEDQLPKEAARPRWQSLGKMKPRKPKGEST